MRDESPSAASPIAGASVDHIELQVTDLAATVERLTCGYGFEVAAPARRGEEGGEHLVALLHQGRIRVRVVQALSSAHQAWTYTDRHSDGVAVIALAVDDVPLAYRRLVESGAVAVSAPSIGWDGGVTAAVAAFGDVVHRLVERRAEHPVSGPLASGSALTGIDHFAVCLPIGELDGCVRSYVESFGLEVTFREDISVGPLGMSSVVVQNASGDLTLTLIEPASQREAGQIESFLQRHGGAGVQHVAFTAPDIVAAVGELSERGVRFLTTPASYYDLLAARLTLLHHSVDRLREGHILVDEDHDGQLFQIFTASEHPRGTMFFEVIERIGARSFGSNNIRALYEAVELQRTLEAVGR